MEDPFIAEDLRQMQLARNYNHWLYSLLQPFLGNRILEIGPGIGNLTQHLVAHAEYVEGIEPNPVCARLLLEAFGGHPKFALQQTTIEKSDMEMLGTRQFDTVVCVNVLEHIANDLQTLVQFRKILAFNGRLVLLVPAMPWAYGAMDAAIGHFRRYSITSLTATMTKAGFDRIVSRYSNLLGLVGWTINSRIRRATRQNDFQIRVFDFAVPVVSRVEQLIRPPLGLSIVAVASRPDHVGI